MKECCTSRPRSQQRIIFSPSMSAIEGICDRPHTQTEVLRLCIPPSVVLPFFNASPPSLPSIGRSCTEYKAAARNKRTLSALSRIKHDCEVDGMPSRTPQPVSLRRSALLPPARCTVLVLRTSRHPSVLVCPSDCQEDQACTRNCCSRNVRQIGAASGNTLQRHDAGGQEALAMCGRRIQVLSRASVESAIVEMHMGMQVTCLSARTRHPARLGTSVIRRSLICFALSPSMRGSAA